MHSVDETYAKHEELLEAVRRRIEQFFPIESKNQRTLRLNNLRWDRKGLDVMGNIREQKKAKLNEGSIASKLLADIDFIEEDGTTIDTKRGYILLTVPHITSRNSYIVGGNEIQVVNQFRLRPGLYTEAKGDDLVETYINTTAAGQYKILLDRKSGIIRFKIGSDKKVPIVAVLTALGASASEIRDLLGDLYQVNEKATKLEPDTTKLLTSLHRYATPGSMRENQGAIKDFLASKPLDPEVTKLTSGVATDKIDLAAVKASIRRCIEVANGREKEDDKESLAFKSIHSMEDFIPERLDRNLPSLKRQVAYKMQRGDTVNGVLPSTLLGRVINDFMTTSEFTRYSDQNNPIDMNAVSSTTTILGEGGISSMQSVTDKVRAVHTSHFGAVDTLHQPEGQRIGITSHLSVGTKKVGNDLVIRVFEAKTGKPVDRPVKALMPNIIAFPDQYEDFTPGQKPKLKADIRKVKVRHNTEIKEVAPNEVEYIFNDPASFFSTSSNMAPFLNSNSANRTLMANKHVEQSVQLADPDVPLVQHRLKGVDKGFVEAFGENFQVVSPVDGRVKRVKKDAIIITDSKGKDHEVLIHENFPLNSKTFLNDTPVVKTGDKVKKGQQLAENNFTKDKTLAIGKNLSVAMVPYKGYNFEDGTVISHKAAQKLASVHKEEYRVEKEEGVRTGLKSYLAQFPSAYEDMPKGYQELYDSDGIIKKGAKVSRGTVLIPAIREVSMQRTGIVALHKKILSNTFSDISSVWNKEVDGQVVDVVKSRGFIKVIIKCVEPAVVGDKLSAFAGAKGIITKILGPDEVYRDEEGNEIDVLFNPFGCHDKETMIRTPLGWVFLDTVQEGDEVAVGYDNEGAFIFETVEHATHQEYDGDMFHARDIDINFSVTPNHRMWASLDEENWDFHEMYDLEGKDFWITDGTTNHLVAVGVVTVRRHTEPVHCVTVPSGKIITRRSGREMIGGNSVGRINPGFLLEAAAGKVAKKTGKTFYVDNFNMTHDSNLKHVQDELKKAGISDAETIKNPVTGHVIKDVLVGPIHTLKLKHKISGKFSARGATGNPYTTLDQPQKVSGESAQKVGQYDIPSLLSAGATSFLEDTFTIKGQRNDEYWRALQLGMTLPPPKTPYVAEKFVTMLLSAGVNLNEKGGKIQASPMTDKEIMRMSHGEVERPDTLRSGSFAPMKRGLFDPETTGGVGGNKFTHIRLAEPMINPLMREAVISVGDFASGVELDDIIMGRTGIDDSGEVSEDGTTGIEAVIQRLKSVDIDAEIDKLSKSIPTAKGTALNKANRRMRYLKALKELDMRPEEAYINTVMPVMPPKFRQITEMPDGSVSVADANHGYREFMMLNTQVKELKELGVDDENLAEIREALYTSAGALVGLNGFVTKGREFRGLLEEINGATESKYGFFKSKLLARPQDLSARSTIIPNPKLGVDEVGLPKKMAMTIFGPFVVRRLAQDGHTALEAKKMVDDLDNRALKALETEVESRPVLINRAPSLHKFSVVSQKVRLTDGKAIETNPLIVQGLNADYDGDTVGVHVPVTDAARKEAMEKLLPSKNLISPRADFVMHAPSKETILGIYMLTTPKGKPIKVKSWDDARAKLVKNEIRENTAVLIGKDTHCVGQQIFNDIFPADLAPGYVSVNGKQLEAILLDVAKNMESDDAGAVISKIKDLGNHYVTELGYAVSLKDLEFDYKKRDAIIRKMDLKVAGGKDFGEAAAEAGDELKALLAAATDNRFVEATFSSRATGKGGAVQQMVATPVAVTDSEGKPIPISVKRSFAEGHDLGSFLGTLPGSRQGLIDKGLSVADTGYLSRLLVNANVHNKISMTDCGTMMGHEFSIDDSEVINRYGVEGALRNVILTKRVVNEHKRKTKAKTIKVRTALGCKANQGICSKCAGVDENGKPYAKGFHIGAQAAQSVGERATQLTLQKFHTGGAVGGTSLGFDRVNQLFNLPSKITGRAVLAETGGRVASIESSAAGGNFVTINNNKHFIPKELGVGVKVGDNVKAGQQISEGGNMHPQDLLEATGDIKLVQNRLVDEIAKAYDGQSFNRRVFETVVKPMTDRAKISDAGDAPHVFNVHPGETYAVNQLEEYNVKLKARGLRTITFEPILMGIKAIPHQTADFVGLLAHERLKDTVKLAPAKADTVDLTRGHTYSQLTLKNLRGIERIKNPRLPR